jgi:hypothetical protein
MLAVGLGIGAAVTHSPVASADATTDLWSAIDSLFTSPALPASSSGLDLAISFDGYSLVHEGNATAYTTAGQFGLAIAEGSGAYAYAGGGTGDVAEAEGTNAYALAGGEPGDTGADYDTAIDIGNNDMPSTSGNDGAFAGNGDLAGGSGTGAHDTAIDIGNNSNDLADGNDGAVAGAGALAGETGDGNNDTAIDVGNNSGYGDSVVAVDGNGNYASESGNMDGLDIVEYASNGNDNTAIADANYTYQWGGVYAGEGNDNYVYVLGPENSYAAALGDSNISYVLDPFGGSTPDFAETGYGFNSDLAASLFTDVGAIASYGNNVYDIVTALGPETGTF